MDVKIPYLLRKKKMKFIVKSNLFMREFGSKIENKRYESNCMSIVVKVIIYGCSMY